MKKQFLACLIIVLFTIMSAGTANSWENTMGVGIFWGTHINDDYPIWHYHGDADGPYEWSSVIIHPTYGWVGTKQWEVYFEGDIGLYDFETMDTFSLGISLMAENTLFDPLYFEVGGGFSYWNRTPNENWVRMGVVGLMKYGFGVKWALDKDHNLKIGYRFTHSSETTAEDDGMNTHGFMVSVSKTF